jgi:hypothetical protein
MSPLSTVISLTCLRRKTMSIELKFTLRSLSFALEFFPKCGVDSTVSTRIRGTPSISAWKLPYTARNSEIEKASHF